MLFRYWVEFIKFKLLISVLSLILASVVGMTLSHALRVAD